jgi:CBS domain-containing protein
MLCPACGYENIAGTDRCDECMEPFSKLDVPQSKGGVQGRLMEDCIGRLEASPPLALPPQASVFEALQLMKQNKLGCLLVTEKGQVVGIFSERDFLYKLAGLDKPLTSILLQTVMTPKPVTLSSGDSIRFALHLMSVGGFRHIPIVKSQCPEGILSIKHVLRYLNQTILSAVPDQVSGHATGHV